MWLADGYCRHTKNCFGDQRKTVGIKQRESNSCMIRDILSRLPFKFKEYKDANRKNVCINLLEVENESLNKKNFALNKENIELLADKKKNDDSMINNTSQITINNVHINNMSSVNKMITDTNKVTFTIESITSSEFNKECNMIPSFTEQDDNKCLADIVINK